ncbi:MAG: zinc-binding dehydrogenase [Planctomycetota bacterium]
MQRVLIEQFGGPEVLRVLDEPTPTADDLGPDDVLVRMTSIGMNRAEIMGREGQYKLSTGDPPFTPGLEGGGILEAVGSGVAGVKPGDRVTLTPGVTRPPSDTESEPANGGAYRSHYLCPADCVMPVPDAVPDDQLGALWLPYLTAHGCLHWLHRLHEQPEHRRVVAFSAASSSVALAAAQVAKSMGATTIGLTSSPAKLDAIRALPTARYDHLLATHAPTPQADRTLLPFYRDLFRLTEGRGVDVFFDCVGAGQYLSHEITALAELGTVYIYGLLGKPAPVNLGTLIRKKGSLRGYAMTEFRQAGPEHWRPQAQLVLDGFANGTYTQHLAGTFPLADVQRAHTVMAQNRHIGKLVLVP